MLSITSKRLLQQAALKNKSLVQNSYRSVTNFAADQANALNAPLRETDPQLFNIIENEKRRQKESIDLIPSENFTSRGVMDALGSVMQNKYSEGYPGARYYGGNQYIDQSETLCQERALELFSLDEDEWGVNVQALSGAPANLYVYYGIMKPHERLMGLDLPHGGHLSHGYQTETKKISAVSAYFETLPYRLDEQTGLIDYDTLEKNAKLYRPKVIVAGASAYSRLIDYKRFREIADSVGAYLMVDMAHISGLIAAKLIPTPFEYADIVTTTTHKSLRGPRGSLIFFRKGVRSTDKKGNKVFYDLEGPINFSVFPGHQGGPHNHTISALAVALKQANTDLFREYQKNVIENSAHFGDKLKSLGYELVSGGTDTHLLLIDLRSKSIDGARVESVLELVNIAANKNTVPGDKSALIPSGLRVGTPAMTSRGFGKQDFDQVAEFLDRAVQITIGLKKEVASSKLKDFKAHLNRVQGTHAELKQLKNEIAEFSSKFPTVGY
ncbi:serine hydroxymethyltransferase, mitochondrial-like protein [Conidiobolus coronatus NRRL 28638]|uniref:glycine hydroxymethyltransferase n=1 Tax=Conidiobolus coronatus (strain ATCC 28846 / CBS 209.66 / NRRL 28638) TaxID=796925 RepID=A0A137NWB7_CONC2|nr:serine hydroxymethyltransferase, mitochondrial-like protein [Conidiobolus coronatus NRRL 28638]|eukprot:KXN67103.1 serine hydroxymethyltransferase, mitochondrial-like protein [Conidiobolus coronatus NRRL 28638]